MSTKTRCDSRFKKSSQADKQCSRSELLFHTLPTKLVLISSSETSIFLPSFYPVLTLLTPGDTNICKTVYQTTPIPRTVSLQFNLEHVKRRKAGRAQRSKVQTIPHKQQQSIQYTTRDKKHLPCVRWLTPEIVTNVTIFLRSLLLPLVLRSRWLNLDSR